MAAGYICSRLGRFCPSPLVKSRVIHVKGSLIYVYLCLYQTQRRFCPKIKIYLAPPEAKSNQRGRCLCICACVQDNTYACVISLMCVSVCVCACGSVCLRAQKTSARARMLLSKLNMCVCVLVCVIGQEHTRSSTCFFCAQTHASTWAHTHSHIRKRNHTRIRIILHTRTYTQTPSTLIWLGLWRGKVDFDFWEKPSLSLIQAQVYIY